ncbi:MAG: glutathione S-transferase family protein [Rhodobacteraceae bacterium]|jgi:glutathione S-transferase|nr:glutathione S-transferase family protein [Paracoccaceae bacterium]
MITLYGVARSRASRPLWLLGEIGADYVHVPVIQAYRLADPDAAAEMHTASQAYLAINPQGQIPCLTDGDLTLTESMAITLYLATEYGGDLGPRTAAEAALMAQWALHATSAVEVPALEIMLAQRDAGSTSAGAATVAVAAEKLVRPFQRLEGHLAQHPYLVGDRFTVADINTAECVRYAQGHDALMARFPALSAWMKTLQARPAFVQMFAQRNAEPA